MSITVTRMPVDLPQSTEDSAVQRRMVQACCVSEQELRNLMIFRRRTSQGRIDSDILNVRVTYTVTTDMHIRITLVELQHRPKHWTVLWSTDEHHQGERQSGRFTFFYLNDPDLFFDELLSLEEKAVRRKLALATPEDFLEEETDENDGVDEDLVRELSQI